MFDEKFLREYALSVNHIKFFFRKKAIEAFNKMGVSEEMQEVLINTAISDEKFVELLENNPCILFEIFDLENIHFYVYPHKEEGIVYYMYRNINGDKTISGTQEYNTRKLAEYSAIREAFEMLETVLKSKNELI